jgi:hypothetical protein
MAGFRKIYVFSCLVITASVWLLGCGDLESLDDPHSTTFVIHADESMALVRSESTSRGEYAQSIDEQEAPPERNEAQERTSSEREPQVTSERVTDADGGSPTLADLDGGSPTPADLDGGTPTLANRSAYCWTSCDCGSFTLRIRFTCGGSVPVCWKYCDKFPGLK